MSRQRVLVTREIPRAGLDVLRRAGLEVHQPSAPPAPADLLTAIGDFDAVICHLADRFDEPVLSAAAAGRCRIVATCSVGTDHIDLAAARRLGVFVSHTPDVLTEAVADLTWALLLAAARRITEAERLLRSGRWGGWNMLEMLGADVHGRTLGIVGAGRIGAAVARRAAGFSMSIQYNDRGDESAGERGVSGRPADNPAMAALKAHFVPLDALLASSDFVSLHVPLTSETRHLIDRRRLSLMRPTSVLINTARGAIVDEAALIEALRDRRIAAAGLDVYEHEPAVPAELLALDNVVLLPHIGSATLATRSRMAEMAAEDVIAVLTGRPPLRPAW
jgi:glyoxylate reductase